MVPGGAEDRRGIDPQPDMVQTSSPSLGGNAGVQRHVQAIVNGRHSVVQSSQWTEQGARVRLNPTNTSGPSHPLRGGKIFGERYDAAQDAGGFDPGF
jgi:hypothetical protein